ncbi:MAG: hypothetical protein CBC35_06190 [Planctomycetes bacterium TMED75]|nr:hypothetical protein [Planctomycetaceae bacterium]OUU93149.1 MAG: hypothetical protein CBC35_06190 [Planctomycetes bacterium TMED75]
MPALTVCALCLFTTLPASFAPVQDDAPIEGWMTQPTMHGSQLVFVSEGDLFTTSIDASPGTDSITAHRLTSHVGRESHPRLSPDGRWLAFSAEYGGNADVFVMPARGGAPTQLTFHPDSDEVVGWSADGGEVLFRSGRSHPHGRPELWRIARFGGMPTLFPFGDCSMAAPSSTDGRMAFCRWTNEDWNWKNYRGGTAPEVWVGNPATNEFANLTRHEGNDLFPIWSGSVNEPRIQFLSDRTGTPNVWSMSPEGTDLVAHTKLDGTQDGAAGFDIRFLSGDADPASSRVVFEQGGALTVLDPATGVAHQPRIHLSSDRSQRRSRFVPAVNHLESMVLSSSGDRLAFVARGDVFVVELESGQVRRVTNDNRVRYRGPAFIGEDWLVVIADAGGEEQLAVLPVDRSRAPLQVTDASGDWFFPPVVSLDERWVVVGNSNGALISIDLVYDRQKTIVRSPHGEITDYRISPDSQWVAWSMTDANQISGIYIAPVSGRSDAPVRVSDGLHNDSMPRWDPAGAYLWFLGDRALDPQLSSMEFRHAYANTTRVYAVCLDPTMPPPDPRLMESVGLAVEEWGDPFLERDEESDPDVGIEPDSGWVLDLDGVSDRVHVLEWLDPSTWTGLEATWGGIYLLQGEPDLLLGESEPAAGVGDLVEYDVASGSSVVASEVVDFVLSGDHRMLFGSKEDETWFTYDSMMGESIPQETPELLIPVDPAAEWAQILDESWRLQRNFFWNPELNGVDWDAMRARYAERLDRVGTRDELDDLIGRMLGELQCSHAYIWQEGPAVQGAEYVPFGMLGADLVPDPRGVRIERILPGRSWDPATSSPLAQPWLGVEEGDVLLEIDGREVVPETNPWAMLSGITGDSVDLVLQCSETDEVYEVTTPLVQDESALRYQAWVDENRAAVDAMSDGRFGYLHLSDMDGPGLSQFAHQYYGQLDRDGLVIDVRNNGGGFVSQLILDQLAQEVNGYDVPRHGAISTYPQHAFPGHLVVIMDQHAGSDGDIFPYMFREMGLGPLVGMRTWGGVVGIRSDKSAIDGGMTTQPEYATWAIRDGWGIENYGVDPDIEVDWTPRDHVQGRDPQLERAIEELGRLNQATPVARPQPPAYPQTSISPLQGSGEAE